VYERWKKIFTTAQRVYTGIQLNTTAENKLKKDDFTHKILRTILLRLETW